MAQILFNRGIVEPAAMDAFINPLHSAEADPLLLPDMQAAVTRLHQAIDAHETIAVYGDYDADGVTATALLVDTLTRFDANVIPYIPHRDKQGYGLHAATLPDLREHGVTLVLTADCGMGAGAVVERGRELGMDFVITDHHEAHPPLPAAVAVVNPRRQGCEYPFRELAGVGVAFRFAQALVKEVKPESLAAIEDAVLDLVAIGTVADVVPLVGENRSLVRRGLVRLNQTARPGLRVLAENARLPLGALDEAHIGFGIAPRLNAAGRIDDAEIAYRLLVTASPEEAQILAGVLEQRNALRQGMTERGVDRARAVAAAQVADGALLLIADEEYAVGVVGLIAAKLCEEFNRPAIVLTRGKDGWRGSARSVPGFDIGGALASCSEMLVRYGGHPLAAGLTVADDKLDDLYERLRDLAGLALAQRGTLPTLAIDAEVPPAAVDWEMHGAIGLLPPYGIGNPEPVFLGRGLQVRECRQVGRNGNTLRMVLEDGRTLLTAVGFGLGERAECMPEAVDVAYTIAVNEWNGKRKLEMHIKDLRRPS
ncbi:MAG: single-stranded-DNA-specific exonuclease RecJ [Chloroflexota bacterium]